MPILYMRPDLPPMSGEAFRKLAGPFSVAVDGFVHEGPWFDADLPAKNFNHHEGCPRLETRATCAQVLLAIRQGFFQRFRDASGPRADVWANDCDEDVCLSWFLLSHHAVAGPSMNPLLNRLVYLVDLLDTTAGAYPFPEDLPSIHSLAWIFEPYRRFRLSGGLFKRDPGAFRSVVEDVEHRISAHITGHGREVNLDTRYEVLRVEKGYVVVHEVGAQARIGMFSNGIQAFLSSTEGPNGTWHHVLGRASEFVDFPIPKLLAALNADEGLSGSADQWGGGTTVAGSPRIAGSHRDPDQVVRILEEARKASS